MEKLVSKRNIILILIPAVVTVAFLAFKGFATVNNDKYYRKHDPKYGIRVVSASASIKATSNREQFVSQAKLIRNKWQGWAYNNKDVIRHMVNSHGKDNQALYDLYVRIPSKKGDAGITKEDFHIGGSIALVARLPNGDPVTMPDFSWNAIKPQKTQHNNKEVEESNNSFDRKIIRDFRKYSDFAISDSLSPSSSTLTIWASGRITEQDRSHRSKDGNPIEIEIAPMFDFLK